MSWLQHPRRLGNRPDATNWLGCFAVDLLADSSLARAVRGTIPEDLPTRSIAFAMLLTKVAVRLGLKN
ncbi:hypothetical protein C2E31_08390 [Rhodopirellula baltica]|nr:hypothetical protein C2E31_08390 [Rhodopirellula baltica]